jgi:hypothetical protein
LDDDPTSFGMLWTKLKPHLEAEGFAVYDWRERVSCLSWNWKVTPVGLA